MEETDPKSASMIELVGKKIKTIAVVFHMFK
jgi:hypothetical protein